MASSKRYSRLTLSTEGKGTTRLTSSSSERVGPHGEPETRTDVVHPLSILETDDDIFNSSPLSLDSPDRRENNVENNVEDKDADPESPLRM